MLFNSIQYLLFLPVVIFLYYVLPFRFRWVMLLLASCLFYMAFIPKYILILFLTILIDYIAGIQIERSQGKLKTFYLVLSIVSTCLVLFFFKYINFFIFTVKDLSRIFGHVSPLEPLNIILPIGLSFHTFQSLSYVIEVYRGNQKAEYHLGIYSLYVMFFPQLVSGPIERPSNLLTQLREEKRFNADELSSGLKLILWGFFKKCVVADRLALFVNAVYGDPMHFPGASVLLASFFFSIQIYCDFSGYSDVALGSAQTMGIHLMKNFDRPYFSHSLSEFWKRWHISLSTWLRDYIYEPLVLAFRHWGSWGVVASVTITFFISGLWHGASWNFVIWGLLHGAMLSLEFLLMKPRKKIGQLLPKPLFDGLTLLTTFLFVNFAYVFFRAPTFTQAKIIFSRFFVGYGELYSVLSDPSLFRKFFCPHESAIDLLIALGAIAVLELSPSFKSKFDRSPQIVRLIVYFVGVLVVMNLGVSHEIPFIYFQF